MCFGRQPCTSTIGKGHFRVSETEEQGLEYRSAMYLLASTSLDFMKEDITSPAQLKSQTFQFQQDINKAKLALRSSDKCRSIEDHITHFAFRLNTSFALATLLRKSLAAEEHWQAHTNEKKELRRMCADACVTAVESFINLHKLTVVAERSWAMLHNGLSCALILLLIDEARSDERTIQLQQQLTSIMSKSSKGRDQGSLLWTPHARILTVMKLLGSARSIRPFATPLVDGVFPNEQRIGLPSNNYWNERGEPPLDQVNSPFNNNNNNNTIYDFSDLDFDQDSLGTLYDSILWGDYQTV
jgi:hypothetical protein